jgi:hypothetical protein
MGVPVRIQRRWPSSAQTDFAIFVFGFLPLTVKSNTCRQLVSTYRMLWPSSRITRFQFTSKRLACDALVVFAFFFLGSPSRPASISPCSLTTTLYVVTCT